MNTEERIYFWRTEAIRTLSVAEDLLKLKHYLEALFFGHLALEKLFKAEIIKITQKDPIYSHDLLILSKYAKIRLNKNDIDFLAKVNVYNIRTRYQDYKMSLYKRANKKFVIEELSNIKKFFNRIK